MISRPASAAGMPCIWMGVGRLMPLALRTSSTGGGSFISAKLASGGGTLSPATEMWNFSRRRCALRADHLPVCVWKEGEGRGLGEGAFAHACGRVGVAVMDVHQTWG